MVGKLDAYQLNDRERNAELGVDMIISVDSIKCKGVETYVTYMTYQGCQKRMQTMKIHRKTHQIVPGLYGGASECWAPDVASVDDNRCRDVHYGKKEWGI